MGRRVVAPGSSRWDLARREVLVVCPRCDHGAVVVPVPGGGGGDPSSDATHPMADRRLVCGACGLARTWPGEAEERRLTWWDDGRDPWFGLPLWLRTSCAGHVLWAYGASHLEELERWVAAGLRERADEGRAPPESLVERLPRWITAADHRQAVLAGCRRLRARLAET